MNRILFTKERIITDVILCVGEEKKETLVRYFRLIISLIVQMPQADWKRALFK